MLRLQAGAGFKIFIKLFSFATFRQCKVTSVGISNWVKNIFDCLINFVLTYCVVKLEGAPLITIIAFLPEFLSIWMPATPVLCFLEIIIFEVSILSLLSFSKASFPYSSSPNLEIKSTFPPNLDIAIAWLHPFPPGPIL